MFKTLRITPVGLRLHWGSIQTMEWNSCQKVLNIIKKRTEIWNEKEEKTNREQVYSHHSLVGGAWQQFTLIGYRDLDRQVFDQEVEIPVEWVLQFSVSLVFVLCSGN